MTANSVLACRGLNKGEEKKEKEENKIIKQQLITELIMTQIKGGLNSRGCAGLPLPRDFGHFASPSWLTTKKKKKSRSIK